MPGTLSQNTHHQMGASGEARPKQERRYDACFSVIANCKSAGRAGSPKADFTLIELLISYRRTGILAALVIFSLTGVTGHEPVAACNTDAKSVETAVAAYQAQNAAATRQTWRRSWVPTCTRRRRPPPVVQGYAISLDATTAGQVDVSKRRPSTNAELRHGRLRLGVVVGTSIISIGESARPSGPGASFLTPTTNHTGRKWHCELYLNERLDPWLQVLWISKGSDLLLVSRFAAQSQG